MRRCLRSAVEATALFMCGLAFIGASEVAAQITTQTAPGIYPATSTGRRMAKVKWETVAHIVSPELDSAFSGAFRIGAVTEGYFLYSDKKQRLALISASGAIRWRSPEGSFRFVRDMKPSGSAEVMLLDPRQGAVRKVTAGGQLTTALELTGTFEQIAPLNGGSVALYDPQSRSFLVRSAQGDTSVEYPWPVMESLDPMQRQGWLTSDPRGSTWVFAFTFGNGWAAYAGPTRTITAPFVEHVDFPAIIRDSSARQVRTRMGRATVSVLDMRVRADTLWVLFGGRSDVRNRVIDRYSMKTGAYLDSMILPSAAEAFALKGRDIALVVGSPRPGILVVRAEPPK